MRQRLLIGLLLATYSVSSLAALFGPGKFEIVQADTRFSETKELAWTSVNNRISKKSVVGGTHMDAMGVYVNPMVTRDRETGKVLSLGLVILNRTGYDTAYGSPNSLGVPQQIIFAIDDTPPIALPITEGDYSWSDTTSYNTVSRSASKDITESGLAVLTTGQYSAIVSGKTVAVRIVGSKRSVTYEAKDLAPSFLTNLRAFYEQKVR